MIKNGNPQNFYNGNIQHIKVNKRIQNNNIKDISPPHQNNYFYNTKINRLILQEAPKNNRIQNIYQQQPVPSNKSIYIEYDFLANNVNNLIQEKRQMQSLYKKNTNVQKLPITVRKINDNEINEYYNKNINGVNYLNNDKNFNNISQSSRINYIKNIYMMKRLRVIQILFK